MVREPLSGQATELIRQQINLRGPITFHEFIDMALYHDRYGYYNRRPPQRGHKGDYFTSLQVSGLFPEIFSEALLAMKKTLGSDQFTLIEMGPGNGEFLEGVLSRLDSRKMLRGFRVWAVEKSRPMRDELWRRLSRFPKCRIVSSPSEIEWIGPMEGCVFSNEFFDALPFHRLKFTSAGWRELYVGSSAGGLEETQAPLSRDSLLSFTGVEGLEMSEGQEIEVRPQIPSLYEEWGAWLSRGYILTVDYGLPRAALFSPIRIKGTWRCFYQHQLSENLLDRAGEQDITSDVDFTQLVEAGRAGGFEPALFCSQGIFLTHLGKGIIEENLNSPSAEIKRSTASAVQQLIHPDAMGERFWVLCQAKGLSLPSSLQTIPHRLSRLIP